MGTGGRQVDMDRDYIALAAQYQADVLAGIIPACKWVKLAAERNRRDLDRQDTDAFPYRFDPGAARRICQMAEMLPHVKGAKATIIGTDDLGRPIWNPLVLEPWQCWMLTSLMGWKRTDNGLRRFRVSLCLIPRKNAKALALDTLIPTPDGWSPVGDIHPGDMVFASDGQPTRVLAESPVMIGRRCYEVEFSTGERITADAGHLWLTTARVDRPGRKYRGGRGQAAVGPERLRTTEEIAETLVFGTRGDRNHSVKLARPLILPDVDLPIDPYSLGIWLGDGHSASAVVTTPDVEVVEALRAAEGEVRVRAERGLAQSYAIGRSYRDGQPAAQTFQGRLRTLGVLNNKHVPPVYLRASFDQRVALLQGLMDSDGTASKAGQLSFSTTRRVLADQMMELASSLGLKPSLRAGEAKLYGRVVGPAYQVQFWADAFPVFRIARKLARQRMGKSATARSKTRQIVAMRAVASVPVKCLTVEHPDGMFLVGRSCIPTHNSTLAAVLVLYMLVADGESGAECYSAATTRDQAKAIAEIAWEMARRSPLFREHFGVRMGSETTRSLAVPSTNSKFAPLSADAHTLDSLNVSMAAIDELHAHKTAAVWNVLDTATGARAQPLLFAITTAGIDIGGVCHQKMAYLEKILDGVFVDEAFFGTNYTIDPADIDHIREPEIQRKANPNYGVSVDIADLERKVNAALFSQDDLNDKLTKHFNVWIRTESSWMSGAQWQTCKTEGLTIEDVKAFPCWIGVDLAEVRDIAALVALFKLSEDAYAMFGRFYLPRAAIDKSPIAGLPGWVKAGYIIETDRDQADFTRIEDDIVKWCDVLNVQEVDFDRALASQMQQSLVKRLEPRMGRDAVERFIITVPQDTPTMDGAMKMTERLVLAKKIQHDGNPAMAWMVSNVVTKRADSNDEIRPSKAGGKDSPNKIDGPVAMFTALSRAMVGVVPKPRFQVFFAGGSKK